MQYNHNCAEIWSHERQLTLFISSVRVCLVYWSDSPDWLPSSPLSDYFINYFIQKPFILFSNVRRAPPFPCRYQEALAKLRVFAWKAKRYRRRLLQLSSMESSSNVSLSSRLLVYIASHRNIINYGLMENESCPRRARRLWEKIKEQKVKLRDGERIINGWKQWMV